MSGAGGGGGGEGVGWRTHCIGCMSGGRCSSVSDRHFGVEATSIQGLLFSLQ